MTQDEIKGLRIGNTVHTSGTFGSWVVEHKIHPNDFLKTAGGNLLIETFDAIQLTRKILKDNLGFEVHDMGDFWQIEKEDFILIQPKFQIMKGIELDYIFTFNTIGPKTITFKHVHHLQNVYYFIQQKELEWKS